MKVDSAAHPQDSKMLRRRTGTVEILKIDIPRAQVYGQRRRGKCDTIIGG